MSVPLAMASTALQIQQQNKQQSAVQKSALNELGNQIQQQQIRENQIAVANGQQMSERSKQALRERAKMRVAAGESGLIGSTIDRLNNQSLTSESYDLAILETNYNNTLKQEYFQKKASEIKARNEINIAQSKKVTGGTAALMIGLSGLQEASSSMKQATMGMA